MQNSNSKVEPITESGNSTKPLVRRSWRLSINFDVDWKFFAIIPALNINFHSKELEFEWLFIGIYVGLSEPIAF